MSTGPTGRALQLLSMLQSHRWWSAAELATRLGVTERTVRRDVDRLRRLDYPIDAAPGRHGGYRLATGAHLPPLILDDDEAVAVAVGLRAAAHAAIDGMEDTSLRALAKIEGLLPHRLRRRVSTTYASVRPLRRPASDELVDPDALSVLAAACRDGEQVVFEYRRRDGETARRLVEPHQLVTAGHRWYLVGWDRRREDWRSYRLDRLRGPRPAGGRVEPRPIPGGDAVRFVADAIGPRLQQRSARIAVTAPADEVAELLRWVDHDVVRTEGGVCVVDVRGPDLGRLAITVAEVALSVPVTVTDPEELVETVGALARHLTPGTA